MSRLRELIDELCPDGVEYRHFDEACTLKARVGWQRLTKKEHLPSGEYMLVTGTDFTDAHSINYSTCVYVDKARYDMDENIQLRDGDVLITKDGTLGKVAYVDGLPMPATLNGGVFVVRAMDDRLEQRFIMHFLLSYGFTAAVESRHTGSTIKHLTQAIFSRIRIPVPPIEVQREIVRILDSFQELDDALTAEIEAREKQYSILTRRLLSREYLETVAGGPIVQKPLKEIALVGSSKRVLKRDLVDAGIPFFRGTEVGLLSEGSPIDPQLFLTEETYTSVVAASGKPLVGDLLLPSVNEAGKIWMVDTDDAFYLKDARVLWVHTGSAKEEVDCRYMRYALSKSLVDNYRILASGSQFAELKISSLETAPILLPPFGVQSMVADKLDDARALLQDRTIGLPAERDARRKQFKYYRDRLLAFPERMA